MKHRTGSALLIVLGVLSFLVVSAVAFSAFMRRSRLPSSYLRRVVASRQLAKAALAHAIDEIDGAIANGVHPGIGGTSRNTWQNRVFFNGEAEQSTTQTAPTLTLEGLAYIPPPLVNEARYWSRKTPTAVWQPFGYDVGRYAYCALDVSDYFDVNRLIADYPRSSAANRRVTIAHLFEDVNHRNAPAGADAWDTFMEKYRTFDEDTLDISFDGGSKIPLVSMADFNLALGDNGKIGENIRSPFAEYIANASGSFYPTESQKQLEMFAAMTFVTDGWFPKSEKVMTDSDGKRRSTQMYDLSDPQYQPFKMDSLEKGRATLANVMTKQGGAALNNVEFFNRLGGVGVAALFDYLDADRTPVTLALPTTERVPMVCGVCPQFGKGASIGVTFSMDPASADAPNVLVSGKKERTVQQTAIFSLDAKGFVTAMAGNVKTLVAYPFLHDDAGTDKQDFTIDGRLSMFFSTEEMGLRASDALSAQSGPFVLGKTITSDHDKKTGFINVKLQQSKCTTKTMTNGIAEREDDAVQELSLSLQDGIKVAQSLSTAGHKLLRVKFEWKQTRSSEQSMDWQPSLESILQDNRIADGTLGIQIVEDPECDFPAYTQKGEIDPDLQGGALRDFILGGKEKTYRLNTAVWLRILSNNEVVDMAPACVCDDSVQNPGKGGGMMGSVIGLLFKSEQPGSTMSPLLRFNTGVEFTFSLSGLYKMAKEGATGKEVDLQPKSILVGDPRYNYGPENWFSCDSENLSANDWIEKNNCPDDIFMATSDTGYLQSIYELAFLPRLSDIGGNKGSTFGQLEAPSKSGGARVLMNYQASGSEYNHQYMWRTYDPFNADRQAFEDLPYTSEGTGMKVNPYTDSTNVMMAAFANTPVDWRRASTNVMQGATDYSAMDVKSFNQKYAWNAYSTGGVISWDDLERVAGRFMSGVRSNGSSDWKQVWDNLGWDVSGEGEFLGQKLSDDSDEIWSVDRKFLYGYWRDCFAAKQQLFLVFVRAEPLLLGGGTADQLPPQLGARAVALVWRDPTISTSGAASGGYPHRTRVLFYRPLD